MGRERGLSRLRARGLLSSDHEYPSFGAGGRGAASVGKSVSMFTRRTWPGPGGSNLSLDVQRSRGCGYE